MSAWTQLSFWGALALIIVVVASAAVVLYLIVIGKIDLKDVLDEPGSNKASLSRFQFMLFTFVVAGLFLMLSVESGTFVNIPSGVLELLGISAATYGVSKGIAASSAGGGAKATQDAAKSADDAKAAAAQAQTHALAAQAAANQGKS